jgi:hypothetical protein
MMASPKKYGNRYPWEVWFRQRRLTLRRGRDYGIMTHGMVGLIRNVARKPKYAVRVRIKVLDADTIHLELVA